MKKRWFISKDSDYFKDHEDIIELESCPYEGEFCKPLLPIINKNLLEARKYVENKDYIRAVESLRNSFNFTFDLKEQKCKACIKLFQEVISDRLIQLIAELQEMTTGLFANKSFKPDLAEAQQVLQEMKGKMKF